MGRLTDLQVLTLTRPGWHGDGDTLYLRVSPRGTKSWIQRKSIKGRRYDLGLGPFPRVSLTEARHLAMGNRLRVRQGHDILKERKHRKHVPTFEEVTQRVYALNRPRWSNESHARGWIQTLQRHAFPELATLCVDSIKRHDVLRVLEPSLDEASRDGSKSAPARSHDSWLVSGIRIYDRKRSGAVY